MNTKARKQETASGLFSLPTKPPGDLRAYGFGHIETRSDTEIFLTVNQTVKLVIVLDDTYFTAHAAKEVP